jgi:type III pantothenate kinase
MKVIATGGLSGIFKGSTDAIDIYDEDLAFRGLKYLYEKNL